MTEGVSAS